MTEEPKLNIRIGTKLEKKWELVKTRAIEAIEANDFDTILNKILIEQAEKAIAEEQKGLNSFVDK